MAEAIAGAMASEASFRKGSFVMYNPRINSATFLLCAFVLAAIATVKIQAQPATSYHLLNRIEVGGEV